MYIVVFAGRNRPKTEWQNTLDNLDIEYVRFHDADDCWYLQDCWKEILTNLVKDKGNPRLVFGASMGGWASLYFQPILNADRVLAFSPQTTTIPKDLLSFETKGKNERWASAIKSSNYTGCRIPKSDGKSLLYFPQIRQKKGKFLSGDGGHLSLAKELGYKTIQLEDTYEHNTASTLKQRGQLLKIINKNI